MGNEQFIIQKTIHGNNETNSNGGVSQKLKDLKTTKTIHDGVVVSIEDKQDGQRIKVRLANFDNSLSDEDLPYCYPLFPLYNNILPKEKEVVRVFLSDLSNIYQDRLYTPAIISQFQNLKEQKFLIDRKITYSEQDYFNQNKKIPLSNIPTADGLFIKKNYVPLLGKGNSDIMIGENEVILRSGKYDTSNVQKNKLNPSVFKILYQNKKSYNIQYADEFLLLSNKGDINFNKENLENNDQNEINKLVNQAHPVAFGDSMVDVLTLMRDLLLTHVHPYDGMKPISNEAYNKLSTFDFNKLFSKHIKIS